MGFPRLPAPPPPGLCPSVSQSRAAPRRGDGDSAAQPPTCAHPAHGQKPPRPEAVVGFSKSGVEPSEGPQTEKVQLSFPGSTEPLRQDRAAPAVPKFEKTKEWSRCDVCSISSSGRSQPNQLKEREEEKHIYWPMTLGSPEGELAQRVQEPKVSPHHLSVPALASSLPLQPGLLQTEPAYGQAGECDPRQLPGSHGPSLATQSQ